MVANSSELFAPRIPRRRLACVVKPNYLCTALNLADKIFDLPDIVSVDDGAVDKNGVCLVFRSPSPLSVRKTGELPFCRLFADRILINGLSEKLAAELEDKGWAVGQPRWTMLHMPRDEHEAEICWHIIWHRYRELVSGKQPGARTASIADLPQFSRSNHR